MADTVKILICDDQRMIHETLCEYMEAEGFSCVSAFDGEEATDKFRSEKPDLVVLDLMMPKKSGIDVCREIRRESGVPIIMLTAKGEEIDRILGLELGADDYIVKPFSPREVVARIKAIFRRVSEKPADADEQTLSFPRLQVSLSNYEVRVDGEAVACTPKEVELLYKLCSAPGRVWNREQLLADVWGYDFYGDTRVVDTQIKRIRQKLPENEQWGIRSIYGVGYKFEAKP
ncbi:MAG: response regulator transcription factor [Clostridiales Family XIII bacterium]|jgi:DNA-binding response OmpR family regulator|nr:response regulator transcription factor [Clostridiales Family XIII bacterium]